MALVLVLRGGLDHTVNTLMIMIATVGVLPSTVEVVCVTQGTREHLVIHV